MAIDLAPGCYFGKELEQRKAQGFSWNLTRYEPFEALAEHRHQNPYLSLLVRGSYQEQNEHLSLNLQPGSVLFRPAHHAHANQFGPSQGLCLNLEWPLHHWAQWEEEGALPGQLMLFPPGCFEALHQVLICLFQGAEVSLTEEYLLFELTRHLRKPPSRLPWLDGLKKLLDGATEGPYHLAFLGEQFHLHPIYLARAFRAQEGLTIGEYQLRSRVRRALDRLYNSEDAIDQIAFDCGFTDAAHLIRSFRLHYQITPRKFRLLVKG